MILGFYRGLGIYPKTFDSFPAVWGYQGQLLIFLNKMLGVGVFGDYYSTGSRVHYADYSGEIKTDEILNRTSFGLQFEFFNHISDRNSLVYFLQISFNKSEFKIDETLRIYEEKINETAIFKSSSTSLVLGIAYQFRFSYFIVRPDICYEFTVSKKYYFSEKEDFYLNNGHERIKSIWNGKKIGVTLGFVI